MRIDESDVQPDALDSEDESASLEEPSPSDTGNKVASPQAEADHVPIEDQTLAELVAQFVRAPRITWRLTKQALAQTSQAIEPARQITFEDSQSP